MCRSPASRMRSTCCRNCWTAACPASPPPLRRRPRPDRPARAIHSFTDPGLPMNVFDKNAAVVIDDAQLLADEAKYSSFGDTVHYVDPPPQVASQYLHQSRIELAKAVALDAKKKFGLDGRVHFNVGGAQAIEDSL